METQTRAIHTFKEGEIFDNRYRLLKRAGSGGFADVWKAEDTLTGDVVALKLYTRLDEEGLKELAKEYTRMADIAHPNLLTGNHFDTSGNIPYLEMRYCDGGNLASKVGKMSNEELLHVARDIAKGLAYLHQEDIVHQDIKPENILYDTERGRYLLSDFGISGKSRTCLSRSVNKANMTLSMTESYAPPEKFSGLLADIEPDTKGDIFSLGMTLFELASGLLPYEPPMATGREMLLQRGMLRLDYSKIADPQLRRVVEECTRFKKSDRPTAEDVLAILEGREPSQKVKKEATKKIKVEKKTVRVTPGAKVATSAEKDKKVTKKLLMFGGALLAAVVVAVVLLFALPSDRTPEESVPEVNMAENLQVELGYWTGPIDDEGRPDGEGTLRFFSTDAQEREQYEGTMSGGELTGKGVLTMSNGDSFSGTLRKGLYIDGTLTLQQFGYEFRGVFLAGKPYNGKWHDLKKGEVYSIVVDGNEQDTSD